jgi:hypothetical protein
MAAPRCRDVLQAPHPHRSRQPAPSVARGAAVKTGARARVGWRVGWDGDRWPPARAPAASAWPLQRPCGTHLTDASAACRVVRLAAAPELVLSPAEGAWHPRPPGRRPISAHRAAVCRQQLTARRSAPGVPGFQQPCVPAIWCDRAPHLPPAPELAACHASWWRSSPPQRLCEPQTSRCAGSGRQPERVQLRARLNHSEKPEGGGYVRQPAIWRGRPPPAARGVLGLDRRPHFWLGRAARASTAGSCPGLLCHSCGTGGACTGSGAAGSWQLRLPACLPALGRQRGAHPTWRAGRAGCDAHPRCHHHPLPQPGHGYCTGVLPCVPRPRGRGGGGQG